MKSNNPRHTCRYMNTYSINVDINVYYIHTIHTIHTNIFHYFAYLI